ncbi:MAG: lysozyme [Acidobacteria bacterium]|nr:lysozyme [Acidobacteriota bacterium]
MLQMYDNDGGKNCTIGYGHLLHRGACTLEDRKKYPNGITEAQAEALLAEDLQEAEAVVNKHIKAPLTHKSDYQGAMASLLRWNKADGVVQRGLIRRRNAEKNLFMKQEFAIWV